MQVSDNDGGVFGDVAFFAVGELISAAFGARIRLDLGPIAKR